MSIEREEDLEEDLKIIAIDMDIVIEAGLIRLVVIMVAFSNRGKDLDSEEEVVQEGDLEGKEDIKLRKALLLLS